MLSLRKCASAHQFWRLVLSISLLATCATAGMARRPMPANDVWPVHATSASSLVFSITENPPVVGAHGGVVTVRANLYDAARCQLQLLSQQDFPVVYSANVRPCVASFRVDIYIGANSSTEDRVVTFELISSHGRYNALAGPLRTVRAFSIVVFDRQRTPFVSHSQSGNWSGYAADGGPFRAVAGTFRVPFARQDICGETVESWVGIDGAQNEDLVQGGTEESSMDPSTGQCTAGKLWVKAWWEVLPGALSFFPIAVHAGDLVTVHISELARHRWQIDLVDATTGGLCDRTVIYAGPAASAEWVVEAPTVLVSSAPLLPYGVAAFDNLKVDGQVEILNGISLVQDGSVVSVPDSVPSFSYLLANGFSVVYTA